MAKEKILPSELRIIRTADKTIDLPQKIKLRVPQADWLENPDAWNASIFIKENIRNRIKAFNKKREWIIHLGLPNAGSIFKNPEPGKSAGMLIESCGLKGKRIGNAEISRVHANVIVNRGGATSKDVLGLIDLARTSVKQKFSIDLELELKVI